MIDPPWELPSAITTPPPTSEEETLVSTRLTHRWEIADPKLIFLPMALLTLLAGTCLQVEKWVDPKTGQSTRRIKGPDSLLRAVRTLINRSSVNAIAVVARFPDDDIQYVDDYREGTVA
ncbi:hypothetical protein Vadar_004000 [Vaccinium darrowii]|uniref:Uncharacterized protein n=1 Tax=Vaccinium darrowii TaxID=229202 RepID=A0ACB7WXK5_9ERIC|nr:hypothetical protein Vadar_004000 [Vaccinium darrowii]